ncbi:MAG: nucleotidyltransferase domain-containing protein [Rhodocyclales bacterium]|jgi:predicted nucleotidyltransferase|nr:nucleotidyltransferase domain-containing protein [Rhodocyclales bacterium]
MTALDLPESYRAELVPLLRTHVPDAEVWAYGSRLNGRAHATSDLDLVVRNPVDPTQAQIALGRLREALSESGLPILVDVLDWARIPESFREEISRAHVVMQLPSKGSRR